MSEIGTLAVTAKPDVGVSYVVTPGEPTSLEVTGADLDFVGGRVLVVDCNGVCGVTGPAPGVTQPAAPVSAFVDRPALPETEALQEVPPNFTWATIPGDDGSEEKYCPGNLPLAEGSLADKHRCYPKCFAETCEGESCFCSGYGPGYDTEESS